ncbi:hypothetical protein Q7P36_003370 [Cladosporium allicinum]
MVNEHDAFKVIGHIPVFGFFYSGIRAAVYAHQGDTAEAQRSGLAMVPFVHSGLEITNAALDGLKTQALALAKSAPSQILDLILAFCKANAVWCGVGVAAIVVAVSVSVWLARRAYKAKQKREEEKLMMMVQEAVRDVVGRQGQPMIDDGSLKALIAAELKAQGL